jgi:light-regulated signal transduction histidine kinase (bacteriophytochrome)
MDGLLNALLSLSRLSLKEMQQQSVNLSALTQSITDRLRKEEPGRRVSINIAPGLIVQGDEMLLSIAMGNLLGNAWKFTSRRPDAKIEFGAELRGNRRIYFVSDNGIGFDMAHVDKLFGVFQRLHSDKEIPGTGIGLAIVQRVIERHRGKIWATGQRDAGATFYFILPD